MQFNKLATEISLTYLPNEAHIFILDDADFSNIVA